MSLKTSLERLSARWRCAAWNRAQPSCGKPSRRCGGLRKARTESARSAKKRSAPNGCWQARACYGCLMKSINEQVNGQIDAGIAPETVRAQLRRILLSDAFLHAPR